MACVLADSNTSVAPLLSSALAGRRAALTDLAAQLLAAVLADLLHLAPTTAVRWMHQAGGNWSRYAAELARTRHHQP